LVLRFLKLLLQEPNSFRRSDFRIVLGVTNEPLQLCCQIGLGLFCFVVVPASKGVQRMCAGFKNAVEHIPFMRHGGTYGIDWIGHKLMAAFQLNPSSGPRFVHFGFTADQTIMADDQTAIALMMSAKSVENMGYSSHYRASPSFESISAGAETINVFKSS